MQANLERGLNRLCAVLVPIWIVYCLFVYPMQRQAQAEKVEKSEFLSCWKETNPPDFKACTDYARLKAGTDLAYGCCRALLWVWRGFKST